MIYSHSFAIVELPNIVNNFCRQLQIDSYTYGMGVDDNEVVWWWRGGRGAWTNRNVIKWPAYTWGASMHASYVPQTCMVKYIEWTYPAAIVKFVSLYLTWCLFFHCCAGFIYPLPFVAGLYMSLMIIYQVCIYTCTVDCVLTSTYTYVCNTVEPLLNGHH